MTKKLLIMLLTMLAMTACNSEKDEPNIEEYSQEMWECPTDGVYEGVIVTMMCTDKDFGKPMSASGVNSKRLLKMPMEKRLPFLGVTSISCAVIFRTPL